MGSSKKDGDFPKIKGAFLVVFYDGDFLKIKGTFLGGLLRMMEISLKLRALFWGSSKKDEDFLKIKGTFLVVF